MRGQRSATVVTGPGETKEDFLEVPMPHRSLAVRGCRSPQRMSRHCGAQEVRGTFRGP